MLQHLQHFQLPDVHKIDLNFFAKCTTAIPIKSKYTPKTDNKMVQ